MNVNVSRMEVWWVVLEYVGCNFFFFFWEKKNDAFVKLWYHTWFDFSFLLYDRELFWLINLFGQVILFHVYH